MELQYVDEITYFDESKLVPIYIFDYNKDYGEDDNSVGSSDSKYYDMVTMSDSRYYDMVSRIKRNDTSVLDMDITSILVGNNTVPPGGIRGIRVVCSTGYNSDSRSHRGDLSIAKIRNQISQNAIKPIEETTIVPTPYRRIPPRTESATSKVLETFVPTDVSKIIIASAAIDYNNVPLPNRSDDSDSDSNRSYKSCKDVDLTLWSHFRGCAQYVTDVIRLRHLCACFIFARGSKFDKNYEMLLDTTVTIAKDGMVRVAFNCDHGS